MVGVECIEGAGSGSKTFISGTGILSVMVAVLNSQVGILVSGASSAIFF